MWRLASAFALGATLSLLACRTDFQEDCPVGNENCACNEDGACIAGLSCLSGVCVDESATGGETQGDAESESSTEASATATESATDSAETGTGDEVVLWTTAATFAGGIDATGDLRADFNAICQAELPEGAGCLNTAAIVSTAQEDSLGSLQNNAGIPDGPVVAPGGAELASSFAELIEMGPAASLATSGAQQGASELFWTATDANGHFDETNSCSSWSSSTDGTGRVGSTQETGSTWLSSGNWACSDEASVLCVCW